MLKVVIGRNQSTAQLMMSVNGMTQSFGPKNSVPTSVSREHAILSIEDDGRMVLKNMNIQNYTFVNMVGIESKRIKER